MTTRIGVDIGGTFTDLLFYNDEEKTVTACKVPTTPHSPDEGCINAIRQVVPLEKSAGPGDYFMHGTTVGLNALLQRKGAVVGLLATEGFPRCIGTSPRRPVISEPLVLAESGTVGAAPSAATGKGPYLYQR